MARLMRWAIVGLTILVASLITDFVPVEARWVRLGDNEKNMTVFSACQSNVELGAAVASNGVIPSGPDKDTYNGQYIYTFGFQLKWIEGVSLASGDRILPDLFNSFSDASPNQFSLTTLYHSELIKLDDGRTTRDWTRGTVSITDAINNPNKQLMVAIHADLGRILVIDVIPRSTLLASCNGATAPNGNSQNPSFTDGRVNNYDSSASAAIYCQNNGVTVYGIDIQGKGYFAFSVSNITINSFGKPAQNVRLANGPSVFGGNIELYLLTNGQLQLNAPGLPPDTSKLYTYIWDGCGSTNISYSPNNSPPTDLTAVPPTNTTGSTITHTIQRGETLGIIARRYGVSVSAIVAANKLVNPNRINVGQQLVIPTTTPTNVNTNSQPSSPNTPNNTSANGVIHIVQSGENLYRIALRYGVSVSAIAAANSISDVKRIYVGQRLIIPGKTA
ncbi:MAG: LysM peptidoglycan-binding domain-containing protein [Anaerolineaceae bacterium]|nr:LysM peptidoglycan-binding domain-containing protein [Anaerolineaceae bacterium]